MTGGLVIPLEASVRRSDYECRVASFHKQALPEMASIEGYRSISFHAARLSDPCCVTMLSVWDDLAGLRRLAADDPARTYLPDFMAPLFMDGDAEATFHDENPVETAA